MVLKLYGSPISTCTKRVALVLHEKQVPFEFHAIDFSKGALHRKSLYSRSLLFTPCHLPCPGIDQWLQDDDGFILYESRAVCQYIAAKYPDQGTKGLLPTELKAAALFQQASSVEMSNFDDNAAKLVFEKLFKPHFGLTFDQATYDRLLATLTAKLDAYDNILGKQKYLAGDELTLADLYHLPYGSLLPAAGTNVLETKPNVNRWFTELSSRPAWLAVKDGIKGTA
ncbi:hypothetical protein NLJ89_g7884 [Agrocybe chaxingu]|uniref:glutathione transferase n=1 Tax=Agrocybe chaxingu TaxID=84603 RepID=A0A9W8MT92_9AGAR|nr:hypothetical protein NLJ89_g7884 [Agrocybe chaxingu]